MKLASIEAQIASLASGKLIFTEAEPWRVVYDALLACPSLKEFRSIAWVRMKDYGQDEVARESMRAMFEAAHRGVLVERVIILSEPLWPRGQQFPSDDIFPWIEQQHNHGFWVMLVREHDLSADPALLADTGIFGEIAVGMQDLDPRARTLRITYEFAPQAVRRALDRWERLSRYGISTRELLDQAEPTG